MVTDSLCNSYIYENLKPLSAFNDQTMLCIYEPTHKLFVVKKADRSCLPVYQAIQTLDNPHVAKVFFVAEKPEHIEVVREYISGDPLSELLRGNTKLPHTQALKIAADVCDGLSDIHRLGYVHRDITPKNIIVSSDGCARIIDFGIARSFAGEKDADTAILGTPGYAAPEQFGFSQSDARTDIYAVGVLLNVMLTGNLPHRQQADGALGRIVRKCTEIDSHQRYKNISNLKKALYRQTSGNSPIERIIRQIPGLRSQNALITTLAVLGYLAAVLFSVAMFSTVKSNAYFSVVIAWILCFPVPFFCFHNFLDIWNRLPFSRGASEKTQRTVYTVLGTVSILFGLLVLGIANQ